jgi:hypothetical protein
MSGGSEQAITHIQECRGDANQDTNPQKKNLTNTTYPTEEKPDNAQQPFAMTSSG